MSTSKRLYLYALKFKKPILIGLFLLTLGVATDIAGPFIAKYIIDHYMTPGNLQVEPIAILLAIFFLLSVLTAVFRYLMNIYLQRGANHVIQQLRKDVFGHIQTLPIEYFDNLPAGKIVARVTNDTEAIRNLYVTVLSQFANSFITIGGDILHCLF